MNSRAPNRLLRPATLVIYAALGFFALLTLLPFLWMICAAVKSKEDFFTSLFLPRGDGFLGVAWDHLTLQEFVRLFRDLPVARALLNSLFLASVGSIFATLFCAMGGYGLSKFRFTGRQTLTAVILGTVVLPVALLLSPRFETLFHLGLLDRYLGIFLPALAPAFGLYLFRQAMINSVPADIIESARMDGCGEFRIFFQIVLPIVRPMISAYLIISFIAHLERLHHPPDRAAVARAPAAVRRDLQPQGTLRRRLQPGHGRHARVHRARDAPVLAAAARIHLRPHQRRGERMKRE